MDDLKSYANSLFKKNPEKHPALKLPESWNLMVRNYDRQPLIIVMDKRRQKGQEPLA